VGKLKEVWKWIVVFAGAGLAVLLGILTYGGRRFKEGASTGDAKRRAAEDREDLQRAEETGDDAGVTDEWRKHR
jgi:hypothetical protein